MKQLLYISLLSMLTAAYSLLFAHNTLPSYDTLSINRDIWKEVHIVYNQDFPYKQHYKKQKIKGCKKTYISSASNNKTETKKTVPVLRCTEHIKLLRPDKTVNHWMQIQHEKHFFPLTLSTFNFVNIHAKITAIRPVKPDNDQVFLHNKQTKKVTGQFERHTVNVKKYTFRNIKTGKTIIVNATPEHPVYVKNRAAFVPMDLLRTKDYLLNNVGQEIRLICYGNGMQHCGESLHNNIPLPVYNLEIDHHHTYFVSDIRLLVHNICELAKKLYEKIPNLIQNKAIKDEEESFLSLKSPEDVQLAFKALSEIEEGNIACDSLLILSLSQYRKEHIPIKRFEYFLKIRKKNNLTIYEMLLHSFIQGNKLIDLEPGTAFDTIIPIAREQPVVVMTKNHCNLIVPDLNGIPVLELYQPGFKIRHFPLNMSTDNISALYEWQSHGQPTKYCTLMQSASATS